MLIFFATIAILGTLIDYLWYQPSLRKLAKQEKDKQTLEPSKKPERSRMKKFKFSSHAVLLILNASSYLSVICSIFDIDSF